MKLMDFSSIKILSEKNQERVFLLALIVLSAVMLFSNLGNRYMWQDESQTPVIAKTVLERGTPYGTDGRNFFSQDNGLEYGKNYEWRWHPWLQFYVLAPFIKIFGFSNFTARVPFVLFAMATVVLLYFLVKELFGSRRKAMLAAALLCFYVPFLILGRMSRYYAPEMFFCVFALYAYSGMIKGKKYYWLVYIAALTGLFHTLYVYFFAVIGACAVHAAVFHRDRATRTILLSVAAMALNIPFMLTIYRLNYSGVHPGMFDLTRILRTLYSYGGFILTELPGWWVVFIVPVYMLAKYKFGKELGAGGPDYLQAIMLPVFFILSAVFCVSVLAYLPFYRNLAGTIPAFALLSALLIAPMFHIRNYAGVLLFVAFVVFSRFPAYVYELTHDFDGPNEGITEYLNRHGKPSDRVLITYGDMPVKLYTRMKVYGGLGGEPYEHVKNPEWVIIRKHVIDERENKTADFIRKNMDRSRYEMITLDFPDSFDENSERPSKHAFWTDKQEDRVVIYKLISNR